VVTCLNISELHPLLETNAARFESHIRFIRCTAGTLRHHVRNAILRLRALRAPATIFAALILLNKTQFFRTAHTAGHSIWRIKYALMAIVEHPVRCRAKCGNRTKQDRRFGKYRLDGMLINLLFSVFYLFNREGDSHRQNKRYIMLYLYNWNFAYTPKYTPTASGLGKFSAGIEPRP
jgi:hypothetical protein